MKTELKRNLPFLTVQQVGELASLIDSTHKRTIKAIERLQKDIDTQKASIANRWKNAQIGENYKRDIQGQETRAAILTIRKNSEKELDTLFLEAGATHRQIVAQGVFYDSPVKTLARAGLGDAKRTDYLHQLKSAGPTEVAHMGQVAVSTRNVTLAAALLTVIDGFQTANRPFTAHHLAESFEHEDFVKVREYLKIAEHRFQGTVIAVRTWLADKANPMHTVSLGLMARTLDESVLDDLEAADAR
ncbi:MAG: hypothetical protein M3Q42_08305 [Pseudomonadota bacterium]|nr:hypothetical protein [Pseudomonadota bacterium]